MIWIFGDSFSTNGTSCSWTRQLDVSVTNVSRNGISEYRILKSVRIADIKSEDTVIICHTNPHRVFIPNSVPHPARKRKKHEFCDLVISDSLNRNYMWRFISKVYFKYFFDEQHSTDMNNLIIAEQIRILKSKTDKVIEVSGFEGQTNSFYDIYVAHPGKINHMSYYGNTLVAKRVKELL